MSNAIDNMIERIRARTPEQREAGRQANQNPNPNRKSLKALADLFNAGKTPEDLAFQKEMTDILSGFYAECDKIFDCTREDVADLFWYEVDASGGKPDLKKLHRYMMHGFSLRSKEDDGSNT